MGMKEVLVDQSVQTREELIARIEEHRRALGKRLIILGHHYQRDDIIHLSDFRGDSLELSRIAAGQERAEYIVFCGVTFMAQCARVLASPSQTVIHPDVTAGCPLADMAYIEQVEDAWRQIEEVLGPEPLLPMTYVNSDATLKAFCGEHGGVVCTSANAGKVFDWAMGQRERVFFFPDEHLGRNTANSRGVARAAILQWDPVLPLGGNTPESLRQAQVILWKGHCHVHTRFTSEMVEAARRTYPGCKIIVHPECTEQVVQAVDAAGSTSAIIRYVAEAEPGSVIVVGTEINLVQRLDHEHPDKKVLPLSYSLCPNMMKISLGDLYLSLEHLGRHGVVTVAESIAEPARLALQRMLSLS